MGISNRLRSFLDKNRSSKPVIDGYIFGNYRCLTEEVEEDMIIPLNEEGCRAFLINNGLKLENGHKIPGSGEVKVKFSWDDTEHILKHGIIAFRVDYESVYRQWENHENELYFLFLEPHKITINILEDVLGNKSYTKENSTLLTPIVSFHQSSIKGKPSGRFNKNQEGQFFERRNWLGPRGMVGLAIDLEDSLIWICYYPAKNRLGPFYNSWGWKIFRLEGCTCGDKPIYSNPFYNSKHGTKNYLTEHLGKTWKTIK
tara:strand:+ start:206 stop:976 length:771 start_codon:yes stop_codon:yes gene_type:complete